MSEILASAMTWVGTASWNYDQAFDFPFASDLLEVGDTETYEGSLVRIFQACVTSTDTFDSFGEVTLDQLLTLDDVLYALPSAPGLGACGPVTGFVHYAFGAWRIEPRDAADIGF